MAKVLSTHNFLKITAIICLTVIAIVIMVYHIDHDTILIIIVIIAGLTGYTVSGVIKDNAKSKGN